MPDADVPGGDLPRSDPPGRLDVAAYLRRLGVREPGRPSAGALRRLFRAHVERVPFESLEIQLGRPTSIDPAESAGRIVAGRGGYCFHLNGAFSALLTALGYAVTWHRGWVAGAGEPVATGHPNHLALTVHNLPGPGCPDGAWFADVGLGDALHEPIPLRAGVHRQEPFGYELAPSAAIAGGWRFVHDPAGSFATMDFAPEPAGPADFVAGHAELSTSPDSPFVRWAIIHRRHAAGADVLTGCRLKRLGPGEPVRVEVDTEARWFAMLADVFGLDLPDVSAAQRRELWSRVRSADAAGEQAA